MRKVSSLLAIILLATISCKKQAAPEQQERQFSELEKANWFLGRWENNSADGNFTESWKKQNDSTFFGESYFEIKGDTVFAEHVSLEERNGKLSYVVTVPNQNEEKPVAFLLTSSGADSLVFENPEHDYPKKIIYKLAGKDSLYAEISGNGKKKGFPFKKK